MRKTAWAFALVLVLQVVGSTQAPVPSVPLGQGRPETPGVTRTTLKDDAKSTVIRVHFNPGAAEPPPAGRDGKGRGAGTGVNRRSRRPR